MKKLIFLSVFIIYISPDIISLDTSSIKFMPLEVGNTWVYRNSNTEARSKMIITKDSVFNNHKYFYSVGYFKDRVWIRTDTSTGSFYQYDSANSCYEYDHEILIDSLSQQNPGPQAWCGSGFLEHFSGTSSITIFGINTINKGWEFSSGQFGDSHKYAKNFGYYYYSSWSVISVYSMILTGCIINGVLYGDTSTVIGIKIISTEIPDNFSLFQNYPNPFNPRTVIQYKIKSAGYVRLIAYDILGREIAILVNENLMPGTYETEWNAENFASGLYFYRLVSDKFTETKKMVLVR